MQIVLLMPKMSRTLSRGVHAYPKLKTVGNLVNAAKIFFVLFLHSGRWLLTANTGQPTINAFSLLSLKQHIIDYAAFNR